MKLNSILNEGPDNPRVILVLKQIWLNLKPSDDSQVIGWSTKQGLAPATSRGLIPGDMLVSPHTARGLLSYVTVINSNSGDVITRTNPEFEIKEFRQLMEDGVFKVLVK